MGFLSVPERVCVSHLYKCQIVGSSLHRTLGDHFSDIFILKTSSFIFLITKCVLFPKQEMGGKVILSPLKEPVFFIIILFLSQRLRMMVGHSGGRGELRWGALRWGKEGGMGHHELGKQGAGASQWAVKSPVPPRGPPGGLPPHKHHVALRVCCLDPRG